MHQVVYEMAQKRFGDRDYLIPNSVPTNVALAAADVLVTDYSSIFFDYASTGRPVVHYVPDLADYRSGRGLYLTEDELPGPTSSTMADLVDQVTKALEGPGRSERSEQAAATFAPKDDGAVCERIVNLVFRGDDESSYTVHRDFGTDKETLLIYLGGMKSMGITTSALSLLRNIDYDRYDVTAFWAFGRGRDRVKNAGARRPTGPRDPLGRRCSTGRRGGSARRPGSLALQGLLRRLSERHLTFWKRGGRRVFGAAEFDHLVDFSGYGCYTPFLFSAAEAKHKSIWLHNDMYADMQRETVGEKHLEDRLQAVFSTYRHFDHLVSVSPELDRVNREKLAAYARPEQFTFAINTIDGDRVLRMAGVTAAEVRGQGPATVGLESPAPAPRRTWRSSTPRTSRRR